MSRLSQFLGGSGSVKSVQRGLFTFNYSASGTITINPVNLDKAVIITSSVAHTILSSTVNVTCILYFQDSSTLRYYTYYGYYGLDPYLTSYGVGYGVCYWQVIEFY